MKFPIATIATVAMTSSARSSPHASQPSSDCVDTGATVVDFHVLPGEEQAEEQERTGDEDELQSLVRGP